MSPELRAALDAAAAAGAICLRYFGTEFEPEFKADDSPVTAADREAEAAIRESLLSKFPSYGFLGEESGSERSEAESVWVVDPIDGTKSFVYGVPLFAVLIGLRRAARAALGVAYLPALDSTYWAEAGGGAYRDGRQIRVSPEVEFGRALVVCGSHGGFQRVGREEGMARVAERAYATRTWGDAYGHLMVASGRAGCMLDPVVNEWDILPLIPIVEEAGGVVTDFSGLPWSGQPEAISSSPQLLEAAVEAFRA